MDAEGPRDANGDGYANPLLEVIQAQAQNLGFWGALPDRSKWPLARFLAAEAIAKKMPLVAGSLRASAMLAEGWEAVPGIWIRATIAVSLMDEAGYRKIQEFGNGHVWDVGSGSGYHAAVLQRLGARVHATDTPDNVFNCRFCRVADGPDDAVVAEIAAAGGAALYFWPWREYYELDRWRRLGGRKVITVGCFDEPDHMWVRANPDRSPDEAPRVCPRFEATGFVLKAERTPPHMIATDRSVQDTMQFWELI